MTQTNFRRSIGKCRFWHFFGSLFFPVYGALHFHYFALLCHLFLEVARMKCTRLSVLHCSSCNICMTFSLPLLWFRMCRIRMCRMCADFLQNSCEQHFPKQSEAYNRVCNTVARFSWTDWKALVWRILTYTNFHGIIIFLDFVFCYRAWCGFSRHGIMRYDAI